MPRSGCCGAAGPADIGSGMRGARLIGEVMNPGWLFVLAGLAVIAAVVLIPAQEDLESALWQRDRALAIERHRLERLERYASYLGALERGDEAVVLSLAANQLNKAPPGWMPLTSAEDQARSGASVFPALEPEPLRVPPRRVVTTRLSRLATGETSRWLMLIGGAVSVLIGLLPATARR